MQCKTSADVSSPAKDHPFGVFETTARVKNKHRITFGSESKSVVF